MVKIMLDAGHDENTSGKRSLDGSLKEFQFNKAVAEKVHLMLKNYEDVEIFFAHDIHDGIDQSLKERTDLANRLNVDCYISIHANASSSTAAKGIETFIHPNAGADTYGLARAIHDNTVILTKQRNRGIKRSDFHVLRETNMKAVLIECGFMTNVDDLHLLKADGYRHLCAEGIVRGLDAHYDLKKRLVKPPEESKPVSSEDTFYRVVAGSFNSRLLADMQMEALKKAGFTSFVDIYKK
jgi:N-acetylmuramoyl-L-alanine amidase